MDVEDFCWDVLELFVVLSIFHLMLFVNMIILGLDPAVLYAPVGGMLVSFCFVFLLCVLRRVGAELAVERRWRAALAFVLFLLVAWPFAYPFLNSYAVARAMDVQVLLRAHGISPPEQLARLKLDIYEDRTNERQYVFPSYVCRHFARDLDAFLDSRGWRSFEVAINWQEGGGWVGHMVVGVLLGNGTGRDSIYLVEPPSDQEVFGTYADNGDGHLTFRFEDDKMWINGDGNASFPSTLDLNTLPHDGRYIITFGESENPDAVPLFPEGWAP